MIRVSVSISVIKCPPTFFPDYSYFPRDISRFPQWTPWWSRCWSLLKWHYFSSPWPLAMSTTCWCPLLERQLCVVSEQEAAVRSGCCVRGARAIPGTVLCRLAVFVCRTCVIWARTLCWQWTGGILVRTQYMLSVWQNRTGRKPTHVDQTPNISASPMQKCY